MSEPRLSVLVVDDDKNIRATLAACLDSAGCEVTLAPSSAAALAEARRATFHLAFVDLKLGKENGLDLVPALLGEQPRLFIVIVTAYAAFEAAVEATRRGAWDFLPKPFTPAHIRHLVGQVGEKVRLTSRVAALETQLDELAPGLELSSRSRAMRPILDAVERVAASDATVLLTGENGTGKGVLARAIHDRSRRRASAFVTINCPTLTEELLASELFGHARGAFTDAVCDQPGRVEAAEGGTLFLDEIGEISPALQAKLLRFLQERSFERIGEQRTRRADVRVVAATNRQLEAAVAGGRFREDLLYRLNVVELHLPPLRERPEDIVPLAARFAAGFARAMGRAAPRLTPDAERALIGYAWPGNVRELRNAIERALILWPGPVIDAAALPRRVEQPAARAIRVGGDFTIEEVEREHIARLLQRAGTLEEAAAILGIDASTLYRKRRRNEVR